MERYSRGTLLPSRFRPRAGRPVPAPIRLRRFLGSVLAASLFLALPPAHAAQKYTQSLSFQTSDQSMWKAGPQYVAGWSQEFSTPWDNSVSGGPGYVRLGIPAECIPAMVVGGVTITPEICTPAIDLGDFGALGSASTSGKIGFRPGVSVNGGGVSVAYPVQVTIEYPDAGALYPGDPFTLFTSFVPADTAALATDSPHARVTVDALLTATFNVSATVKAGSLFDGTATLSVPPVGSDNWERVLDTDSDAFKALVKSEQFLLNSVVGEATNGVVSGGFKHLSINTKGGLLPGSNSLGSSKEQTFFTTKIDYTNAALTVAGLKGFNKTIDVDLGSNSSLHAALQILDAYEKFDLKVGQKFQFDPSPQLSLLLSNGQTINLNAGQSTPLTFPTVSAGAASNDLTITPTYSLDNKLTNQTDLIVTPSYNFTPLKIAFTGNLDAGDLGSFEIPGFDLDPAGTFSRFPGDMQFNLFSDSFALQGFDKPTTAPFKLVGYTYPLPGLSGVTTEAFKPGAVTHLTAAGTKFVQAHTTSTPPLPSSTVQWNGSNRTTQYVSGTQLTFDITSADSTTEGIFPVTVFNPAPAGGASNSKNVIIDGTPPVTTKSLSGPQNANNHGWYTSDVTVKLSTNDAYSGVSDISHQVDGGAYLKVLTFAPLGPGTFSTPAFTVSGEGTHTVNYKSSDNVGNEETQKSQAIDIDGTPPTITGSPTPSANPAGWNNGPVTVHFAPGDATSGVFSCTPDTTLSAEGSNQSVSGTAFDNSGNSASAKVSGINIDLTPPIVTYAGNAGSYTPDQSVNITCSSADPNLKDGTPGSGVQSNTCKNITGPGYSFLLGVNSFTASATDKAGNTGTGQTSFTVQVTFDSLCTLTHQFLGDSGIANSLCSKLAAASAAAARGQLTTKSNILSAFINEVAAQSGKALTRDQAATLTKLAQAL